MRAILAFNGLRRVLQESLCRLNRLTMTARSLLYQGDLVALKELSV